jgi:hypothetical protein
MKDSEVKIDKSVWALSGPGKGLPILSQKFGIDEKRKHIFKIQNNLRNFKESNIVKNERKK